MASEGQVAEMWWKCTAPYGGHAAINATNYIEVNLGPSPFVISAGSCSFSYCPFAGLGGQSFQIIW